MTRISNLLLAMSLAILPISAFAQPSVTTPATAAVTTQKTPEPSVKTGAKTMKTTHAKLGTKSPIPAKTAEPSKS